MQNQVVALLLLLQNLQRFFRISRSDNAVRHLSLDEPRTGCVADIAEGDKIAERAHAIRASGTSIRSGDFGIIQSFDVIHEARLLQTIAHLPADGGGSWADMLKGCSGRFASRFVNFFYQLPAIQSVQQIDVTGLAV